MDREIISKFPTFLRHKHKSKMANFHSCIQQFVYYHSCGHLGISVWYKSIICHKGVDPDTKVGDGIHVNPERSFGGTNGEPSSEASQLRKGGPGVVPRKM